MALDPDVAAVRLAVRRTLADVEQRPVVVACSGGADSLALLAGTVFEARRHAWHVVGVTVDHGIQEGSAQQAEAVVAQMAELGVAETVGVRVAVVAGGRGPEAAAREARYAVLGEVAGRVGASVVLLGHTLDDQAETVLLGLTRGAGGRALAGMRRAFAPYRRPLLELSRTQTEGACRAQGITFWTDPHNEDPRFTRARVRHRVLPLLEQELGPGVASTLARTADLLREDVAALDEIARLAHEELRRDGGVWAPGLEPHPAAVATRVLRLAALEAGSPASQLFREHVLALRALAEGPSGPLRGRQVQLPGHVTAYREDDLVRFRATAVEG